MSLDQSLREHLIALLEGGNAHITFSEAIKDFPIEHAGVRPTGAPHSAWELLEHIRIAQEDIVVFSTSSDYVQPAWPDDYWPASPAPESGAAWNASVQAVKDDLARFIEMLRDDKRDLFEPFPWGDARIIQSK